MKTLKKVIKIATILLFCLPRNSFSEELAPLKIRSIELEHVDPSVNDQKKRVHFILISSKNHNLEIQNLLKKTRVNSVVTLEEYLSAVKNVIPHVLQSVSSHSPTNSKEEGAKISNLKFEFEDGVFVVLNDVYRDFDLSGYFNPSFTTYLTKHAKLVDENTSADHNLKPTTKIQSTD